MEQEIITPEIIDIQPAPVKGALAKTAWDSLPLEARSADNLAIIRGAISQGGGHEFLSLCQREGLRPDFSVVVNHHHTEIHYHQPAAQQPAADPTAIAIALQEAQRPLLEALAAQQRQLIEAQQYQHQYPQYWPHEFMQVAEPAQQQPISLYIEAPDVYNVVDFHPSVSAHSESSSRAEAEARESYSGGGFILWFGLAWLVVLLGAFVSASGGE